MVKQTLLDWCKENNKSYFLNEWDYDKNKKGPEDYTKSSGQKVYWICEKGHSWKATIGSRTNGNGCPYCSNQRILKGYNDLTTTNPELLEDWDYHNNDKEGLKPEELTTGSGKQLWWLCKKGHSYKACARDKKRGRGCPYCSGHRVLAGFNDITTTHSDLIKEWYYTKNIIKPEEVSAGSEKKVWWKCKEGHSWECQINSRTSKDNRKGTGCPYCSNYRVLKGYNDFKTLNPELVKEWDYTKNKIKPEELIRCSDKKVWWLCEKGHSYQAKISNRVHGSNCPYCSGRNTITGETDLLTTHPELCKEWDYKKNKLQPSNVSKGCQNKVFWLCDKGHSWKAIIANRVNGRGCPECNNNSTSFPEQFLYYALKQKFKGVENGEKIGRYKYDIYIKDINLVIEYDGIYFHRILQNSKDKDIMKEKLILAKGYDFIRIKETKDEEEFEMLNNTIIYKNRGRTEDLVQIFEIIINYINNKYNLGIDKGLPDDIEQQARENAVRERYENSIEVKRPDLANEWDYRKNGSLKPSQFKEGSKVKIWWKCSKGHEWRAIINSRTSLNTNCPYCTGQRVIKGETDLATTHPDICEEWDYQKNELKPDEVSKGKSKKVWWLCDKGHSYQTYISSKVKGCGCPYCTGVKVLKGYNDLTTKSPKLAKQWDYKKNIITPEEVTAGSGKKVYWLCEKGHSWKAVVDSRVRGNGCPQCAGRKQKVS